MRTALAWIIAWQLFYCVGNVFGQTTDVTVLGRSGPWWWCVSCGLNTNYLYGQVAGDADQPDDENGPAFQAQPTVVSMANGFRFSVGDSLTISYVSGLVAYSYESGIIFDALGNTDSPLNNFTNGDDGYGPSYYMNPSLYPIYTVELVGTFADSSGQIVGTPFPIGDLATVTVPPGATQLQLGANDNAYYDNPGSWTVQVSETVIPEPSTVVLVLASCGVLVASLRRTHQGSS
jgi:hypothetical protein